MVVLVHVRMVARSTGESIGRITPPVIALCFCHVSKDELRKQVDSTCQNLLFSDLSVFLYSNKSLAEGKPLMSYFWPIIYTFLWT